MDHVGCGHVVPGGKPVKEVGIAVRGAMGPQEVGWSLQASRSGHVQATHGQRNALVPGGGHRDALLRAGMLPASCSWPPW